MLRTSERGTFKRCRWLWDLEFNQLRKPNVDTPPLMFGSMIHIALHGRYPSGIRRGPHPTGLFEKAIQAEAKRVGKLTKMRPDKLIDAWAERIELGIGMLNNYVDTYGKDEEWKVLAGEIPFKVIVNHPRDGITPWFWYTGILDLLMEHRPTKFKSIWDHKTAAAISTKYLALDDQTTAYWTFGVAALRNAKKISPTEKLDGLWFNFLRKQMPDDRPFKMIEGKKYFLNNPTKADPEGAISKKQPAPYFHRELVRRASFEMASIERRAQSEMFDMEAVRREPEAGAYKNPTKWTCPGCWAFDICELNEMGADWETVMQQTTHLWDPYEAHEVYFGEAR